MTRSILLILALLGAAPCALGQALPIAPFTGAFTESFESQPAQAQSSCVVGRLFSNQADICGPASISLISTAPVGPVLGVPPRSGVQMFYTDWGVTLTFDLPVRRFGGYFAGLPGDATFYGVGGQPIEQTHYLTNCSPQSCAWTWNGWEFSADQPVTRIVFFGLGATGGHFQLDDLELDLAADRPPVTYCTAGTSAIGCQALLFASGTPSASASSGFTLRALGVETPNQGLFFFGTNGRQAAPWGNGSSFQCVTPPVQRGGLLSTVGAFGFCAGSLHQDLNARWCPTCPKPAQNPGPGAVVQAQLWYRDPLNTSNQTTSLSNAVEFTMAP